MRRLLLLLCCCIPLAHANNAPNVLTSIKPLQLIAAAITEGVSTPGVLLPPGATPHSYQLRPSQRRELTETDLVLWVGPALEPYLAKLLSDQPRITAMTLPGIQLAPFSSPQALHQHEPEHHHTEPDHHDHQGDDPHIWLYPDNARHIAQTLASKLQQLDPNNSARYGANLSHFQQQLDLFIAQSTERYPHLRTQRFFVFHDAWGYLARTFELKIAGHVTLSPEQQPGIRHMTELRQQFKDEGALCIMTEPGFEPAYLDRLVEGLPVSRGQIDPLATSTPLGPEGYLEYLTQTLATIEQCVTPQQ